MGTFERLRILIVAPLLGGCWLFTTSPDAEVDSGDADERKEYRIDVTQHEQPLQRGEKIGYAEAWAAFVESLASSPHSRPWNLIATRHRRAAPTGELFVDVKAIDGRGRFVTGLAAAQECFEWQVTSEAPSCKLELATVTESDQKARLLGVAADYSGSLNAQRHELTSSIVAIRDYIESRAGEFVLVAFGKDEVPFALYHSPTQVDERAIQYLYTSEGGATPYVDALALTLEAVGERNVSPAAVVVWSDGGENSSILDESYVIDLSRRLQVPIYSVGIGVQDQAALQRVAIETGGNYYADIEYGEIGQVLNDAAFGQEAFYTVALESSGDCAALHTVVISLVNVDCGPPVVIETGRQVPVLEAQGLMPPEFVSVYFDSGDHSNPKLAEEDVTSYGDVDGLLRSTAWYLRNFSSTSVKLDGYADSVGRNATNKRLSLARRKAVQDRLWAAIQALEGQAPWLPEVDKERIDGGRAHGEEKLRVDNSDSPKERRVDIRIRHDAVASKK